MRLQDVMRAGVVTIGPDELASTARARMWQVGARHLVVMEGARAVGIVSQRDLRPSRAATLAGRRVRDVMATDVATASPRTTLRQAANLMRGRSSGCLIVAENARVVGLVTATDLLDQLGGGAEGRSGPRPARRPSRPAAERAPLPAAIPRGAKVVRGGAQPAPAHVRVIGAILGQADRNAVTRKLGMRLGKFVPSIERISVRLSDVNGPKGGVDHRCVIKVVLRGLPSVVVERRDAALQRAIDAAIDATGQAVRRSVQRRRLKPLRRRAGGPAAGVR